MSAANDSPQLVEPRADFERLTAKLFKTSHHVEAPFRRRKTRQELIDSHECLNCSTERSPAEGGGAAPNTRTHSLPTGDGPWR